MRYCEVKSAVRSTAPSETKDESDRMGVMSVSHEPEEGSNCPESTYQSDLTTMSPREVLEMRTRILCAVMLRPVSFARIRRL